MQCKYGTEKKLVSMKTKLNTLERFNKGELLKKFIFCQIRRELRAMKNGKVNESVLRMLRRYLGLLPYFKETRTRSQS